MVNRLTSIGRNTCNLPDYVDRDGNVLGRNKTGSNAFSDVQVCWKTPWDAAIPVGVNSVLDRVGPMMNTQPSSGFSYCGGFDIGRSTCMKSPQRF